MFLDGRQPVKYGLKMEIDDRYSQLKEELSRLCGIPSGRLLLAEIASSLFRVSIVGESYDHYTETLYLIVGCTI